MRRVSCLKVGFAILGLGFCLGGLSGGRAGAVTLPGIIALHTEAVSFHPGRHWTSQRHARPASSEGLPSRNPSSPERSYLDLWKFLAGGLLGGLLWSLLFSYPLELAWGPGSWPFGFLDVVAFTTVVYMGYRLLCKEKPRIKGMPNPGFRLRGEDAVPVFTIKNEASPGLSEISQRDPGFDLAIFVEFARQMVFDLHDAWNHEELERIKDRVTEPMLGFLGMGLKLINLRGEISRMEDLDLSRIAVVMALIRGDRLFIKVSFAGRVVDYLLERHSFKLISGSMSRPEKFDENWTFERKQGEDRWLLADIQDSRVIPDHEAA